MKCAWRLMPPSELRLGTGPTFNWQAGAAGRTGLHGGPHHSSPALPPPPAAKYESFTYLLLFWTRNFLSYESPAREDCIALRLL